MNCVKAYCTKDGPVVDFSSNEKAKQCLGGRSFLVEYCDLENMVCSLMTDSKSKVLGVGELVDLVRFGDLKNFAGDCVCLPVCCLFDFIENK